VEIADIAACNDNPGCDGFSKACEVEAVPCATDDNCPDKRACIDVVACPQGEACADIVRGVGECGEICTADSDCPPIQNEAVACYARPATTGTKVCRRNTGWFAPTYTPTNGQWIIDRILDLDGDGIPNNVDLCLGIPINRDPAHKRNCNVFAESERDATKLGDACDPVPCPYSQAAENFSVGIHELPLQAGGASGNKRSVKNKITHDLVGSRSTISGIGMSQHSVKTEYRFCQPDPDLPRVCSPYNRQVRDGDFEGDDVYDPFSPDSVRWRRVSMSTTDDGGIKGFVQYLDYPSKKTGGYWDYWKDRADWIDDGYFVGKHLPSGAPPDRERQYVSGLSGWFGVRAGGTNSADLLGTSDKGENGIHYYRNEPTGGNKHGYGLGRYYFPIVPDQIVTYWFIPILCGTGDCLPQVFDLHELARRAKEKIRDPAPWMHDIPNKPIIVTNGVGIGFINDDGKMVPTPGLLGTQLAMAVSDDRLMYVSAAEPYIRQGIGYQNVHGIVMAKDGTAILGSVVEMLGELDLAGMSSGVHLQPEATGMLRDALESIELDQQSQIRQTEAASDWMGNVTSNQTGRSAHSGLFQMPENCVPQGARDLADEMSRDSATSGLSYQPRDPDSASSDQSGEQSVGQSASMSYEPGFQSSGDQSAGMTDNAQSIAINRPNDPGNSADFDQSQRIGNESSLQDSESRIDENSGNRVNTDDDWQRWIGPTAQAICIPPRRDFVPVLSRVFGALFLVGGQTESGANTGEIWMVAGEGNPELLDVSGYEPRRVLAATVGVWDRMLWILDEGDEPSTPNAGSTARLVRINLHSMEHGVVWEGMRQGNFDKHWLSVDDDGRVLLTSSSQSSGHVTVKFESLPYVFHSVVPMAMHHGDGYLVIPPVSDDNGYYFAPLDAEGRFHPVSVPELGEDHPNGINLESYL